MNYLKLPNKVYDILKWICLLLLPACSAFYGLLANVWGLPYAEQIPATISGFGLFLGSIIGISQRNISKEVNANESD